VAHRGQGIPQEECEGEGFMKYEYWLYLYGITVEEWLLGESVDVSEWRKTYQGYS
jgi:hypothetical protein